VQAVGVSTLNRINYMAKGGHVFQEVPGTPGSPGTAEAGDNLGKTMAAFNQHSQALAAASNKFNGQAASLAQAMTRFPSTLEAKHSGRVEVVINGQEAFAKMMPAVEALVTDKVAEQLRRFAKEKLLDA
jgi:hypothetical protein